VGNVLFALTMFNSMVADIFLWWSVIFFLRAARVTDFFLPREGLLALMPAVEKSLAGGALWVLF
jgi:hypothetical protein